MMLPGHTAHDQQRGDQGGDAEPERPGLLAQLTRVPERDADDDHGGADDRRLGHGLRRATKETRGELDDATGTGGQVGQEHIGVAPETEELDGLDVLPGLSVPLLPIFESLRRRKGTR